MENSPAASAQAELPFCILIPAGPGDAELVRVADLLEACATYADLPLAAVIINDGNDAAALAQAGHTLRIATTVLPNARNGRGDWWCGGLDMAMIDALLWIARHLPCSGVLRLDSDALVINPCVREIAGLFARDRTLGMMGNFESPTGAPRPPGHRHTAVLYWRSKKISCEHEQKKLIFSFWGWRRKMRLLIRRALQNGYVLGDCCQGGGYALSPEFLLRLAADPFFSRPRDFLRFDFCEDVLMSVSVHALGLRIHYTTGPARLFASQWKGLCAAPEALARAGHAVIHSIKDQPGLKEAETREFFSNRRQTSRFDQTSGGNPATP